MQRPCVVCGKPFEGQRPTAKFCSKACSMRSSRAGGRLPPPDSVVTSPVVARDLVSAVTAELEAAGRLDSVLGQQALLVANQLSASRFESGIAALSKELRAVMGEALSNVQVTGDAMDELKVKRQAKRAG